MPAYYAAGNYKHRYTIVGGGFGEIPDNAIAIPSTENDNPLQLKDTQNPASLMRIVSKTENTIVFEATEAAFHVAPAYIGAILSADRSTEYWINMSRPIPEL